MAGKLQRRSWTSNSTQGSKLSRLWVNSFSQTCPSIDPLLNERLPPAPSWACREGGLGVPVLTCVVSGLEDPCVWSPGPRSRWAVGREAGKRPPWRRGGARAQRPPAERSAVTRRAVQPHGRGGREASAEGPGTRVRPRGAPLKPGGDLGSRKRRSWAPAPAPPDAETSILPEHPGDPFRSVPSTAIDPGRGLYSP